MADDAAEIPIQPTVSKTVLDQFKKTFVTTLDDALEEVFKNLPGLMAAAELPGMKGAGAAAQGKSGMSGGANIAGKVQAGANVAGMAAGLDVKGVLGAAGPWGMAASAAVGALETFVDTIKRFVAIADPAIMEVFETAMADVSGVIGQFLVPVIETAIPFVEMFGDFLASILPDANMLREALKPLGEAVTILREAIDPLIPIIRDVLVEQLKQFAMAVKLAVDALRLMPGMGLLRSGGKTDNWKSGRGSAARGPAKYESIEGAGRGMQLTGFSRANLMDQAAQAQIRSAQSLANIDSKTSGKQSQPVTTGNA